MEQTIMHSRDDELRARIAQKNLFIEQGALDLLAQREDWKSILAEIERENPFVINESLVNQKIIDSESKIGLERPKIVSIAQPAEADESAPESTTVANDARNHYRILDEFDITGKSFSEGRIEDFIACFQDKFNVLKALLEKRTSWDYKPLSRLRQTPDRAEFCTIAMVEKKWPTKKGHFALKVEDLEESGVLAIALKDNKETFEQAKNLLLDDVIAIKARKATDGMLIIEEIAFPDTPIRTHRSAGRDVDVCLISDTHVGSKLFIEKEFQHFIKWLNLESDDEKEVEKAKRIKYLLIAGDVIDGVGVYPDQYDKLLIKDIYKQYDVFCDYILQIRRDIDIFIIPGQHDATRWAEPQPAVSYEFMPKFKDVPNIHPLGSPSMVEIEGLKVLLYHGPGLMSFYGIIDGVAFSQPHKAMVQALKRRSLLPSYGVKQPIVPEKKDYLVIREVPDIFVTGDGHHIGYSNYNGTMLMNAGTWELQSEYQAKQGFTPTPGIALQLNLKTFKITENHFYKEKTE